ncbi:46 kDa FK506-binding nuclear protein isoform X2 [Hetaerina americana]|uniref:46 kDa FK506-binding nuclear protein isoform X2 n=1 Tax=Hetaerina americana TaxID=62018 RepID=UPI003A7F1AB8
MFWALVIEPNKRYTQVVSKSFHVSMACMDLETADGEVTSVMLEVGDEKLILCNLSKSKSVQQPLDLNFQVGDEISFYTKGKASVHLTGYLIIGEDFPELMSDQESEDEDEEEEDEEEAKARLKALASKAMKRGIEEKSAKNKKPKLDSSVGEEDSDEDDEDFEIDESSEEETGEDMEEQGASSDEDDSDEGMEVSMEMKKGKKDGGGKKEESKAAKKATPMKKDSQEKGGEKKNESMNGTPTLSAKKKKQKDGATPKAKETPKTPKTDDMQKKTLPGGVAIEDIKIGNGPIAKAGRMVSVYYVGRLKHNNKQFDSTQQGPGFKFRLGSNEVIKGWDIGVSGMKVGGKRKIVCPPNMAYGSKGSPPVIPPNSSLVFEVELKGVN